MDYIILLIASLSFLICSLLQQDRSFPLRVLKVIGTCRIDPRPAFISWAILSLPSCGLQAISAPHSNPVWKKNVVNIFRKDLLFFFYLFLET